MVSDPDDRAGDATIDEDNTSRRTTDLERQVGIVGIGLVGLALAERWLDDRWSVVGYDVDVGRAKRLRILGGATCDQVQELFAHCRKIVLSLPDSKVVDHVLTGVAEHVVPGSVIIDTTTGDPNDSVRRARELAARGATYLDATIVGSSEQVRSGEAVAIVGGDEKTAAACQPLLAAFARRVLLVGPSGAGARMKLVVNLVLGLNRAALAEGLMLGRACGFDLEQTLEVLRATPAYSAVMDTKGPKMVAGDFTPHARLEQHLKDVRLILELGARRNQQLPLSTVHCELLERAVERGWGGSDNSAIMRAFE